MLDVTPVVRLILTRRREVPDQRSVLVGITGIDGSGKGYVAERVAGRLREQGVRVAVIGIDGWLNLPSQRFSPDDPARHFYEHAIRFEELFARLVLPLKAQRSHRLDADLADATDAVAYRRHTYEFADTDVILLEGIFLLKQAHRAHFDLCVWIDCTFETALERALRRGQEGLALDEMVRAYETVYFPAQRLHIARDDPRAATDLIIVNDPRISAPPCPGEDG